VRTLDAIHLAAAEYLRRAGAVVSIATYDRRLADAGARLGFALA
jgi:predicted nucleic acid-binding protein